MASNPLKRRIPETEEQANRLLPQLSWVSSPVVVKLALCTASRPPSPSACPELGVPRFPPPLPPSTALCTGPSIQASSLGSLLIESYDISEFFKKCDEEDLFDGPLTDYACSDVEEGEDWGSPNAGVPESEGTTPSIRKRYKADSIKKRRNAKRSAAQKDDSPDLKNPPEHLKPHVSKHRVRTATGGAIQVDFSVASCTSVTGPGWVGKTPKGLPRGPLSLDKLCGEYGLTLFAWSGRDSHLLLDRDRRVIGVLVGQPQDEGWRAACKGAYEALQHAASSFKPSSTATCGERRGISLGLPHGISLGPGLKDPHMIGEGLSKKNRAVESLAENRCIQRLCKHASTAYATYGERNFVYMKETVERAKAWSCEPKKHGERKRPRLKRDYDSAIGDFPCRTFNLSEQSVSSPHTDQNNLAQGWCSITPLGSFDPRRGGHLVLWDFGLVVQFPPGATALIPSALVCHSNATIQPNEVRFSIVQYASGRIFRWVSNGCSTDKAWLENATPQAIEARNKEKARRWENAARSYSTQEELLGAAQK